MSRTEQSFSLFVAYFFIIGWSVSFCFNLLSSRLMFWYLISSIFTFVIYAWDKYQAKRHGWRIPENNLHLLSVCGGWLGALVAQHLLQHKTNKINFRRFYWVTILINIIGLIAWHTKQIQQVLASIF